MHEGFRRLQDSSTDSLNIEMEYLPHSQLYDVINTGIELDLILSDANDRSSADRLQRVK